MTDKTKTPAKTETNAPRAEWPQRFGKMISLDIKSGRNGDYGIVTVDCGKFKQTAFIFNETALANAKSAASKAHGADMQANVWMKGPIESVDRGGFTKDEMKIVYFKDNTEYAAEDGDATPEAAGEESGVSEETASQAETADLDDEIPF